MLLIAAALAEELETALNLCSRRTKTRCAGVPMWLGNHRAETIHFLKLGVGPERAGTILEGVLAELSVTEILNIGYAGALDPGLRRGDLVVVDRADLMSQESWGAPLEEIGLGGSWALPGAVDLLRAAQAAGLPVHRGAALTSRCVMGAPEHKRILFRRFEPAIVDMETAALARAASNASVPIGCVRAISDEAEDDFFACLSYSPRDGALKRAAKIAADGGWLRRYSVWRGRSLAARQALGRFLSFYLDSRHL